MLLDSSFNSTNVFEVNGRTYRQAPRTPLCLLIPAGATVVMRPSTIRSPGWIAVPITNPEP